MEPLKYILYFFLILFIAIQFIRPERNIGDRRGVNSYSNTVLVEKEIDLMLDRSCYDCHSNKTNYPWYSEVAPVSWYISSHVKDGKKRLNFSNWNLYSEGKRDSLKKSIADLVKRRWMPMHDYLGQHPEAILKKDEIESLSSHFEN